MLKAIIVDDESRARKILASFLTDYCEQVEIVAQVEDVPQGVKAIKKFEPDIVFLDIEMPGYNGFQLLDFFDEIQFEIVFTTAYSEFALKAFQVSAIDYLLKPIQIDQLINAVNKVERIRGNSLVNERVQTLQANLEDFKIKKIVIPLSEGSLFIELKEIIYLKAEGSYVNFFLKDGTKILASKNIKDFEEQLTQTEGFFRTHRSFLINTAFITNISSDNTGVTLNGNAEITIARERKQDFIQFLKHVTLK
ncbi:MAG TPA: LytTR family DNA-binding domain-containing protein [Chitinophagaceae bacterium]|jgi:two-component system LytT family response regulator|nr:LytTR family DNA-binding domain-containing protein [Chitinophagaceae bacterium]